MKPMEQYLIIPELNACPGVDHLFGTRWVETPAAAARFLGLPEGKAVSEKQVHGDAIRIIDSVDGRRDSEGKGYDALVTHRTGIVLSVATADCLPVLMVDRSQKVIAAVHAGWRGSLKRISAKVVSAMKDRFNSRPGDLHVGFGPSAGGCCYEVDQEVLDPLRRNFSDRGRFS